MARRRTDPARMSAEERAELAGPFLGMGVDLARRAARKARLEFQDRTEGGWYASDLNSRRLVVLCDGDTVVAASIG